MDNKVDWKQFLHYCLNRRVKLLPWAFIFIIVMCAASFLENIKTQTVSTIAVFMWAIIVGVQWVVSNHQPDGQIKEAIPELESPEVSPFLNPDFFCLYNMHDTLLLRNKQKNEVLDLMYQTDQKNDIVVVYGPSGCGKSHLMKLFVQGGEFSRKEEKIGFSATPALDVSAELKNSPCVLAKSKSTAVESMLLIDQAEQIPLDVLCNVLRDNLPYYKIVIAVTDSGFGDTYHAVKQVAIENNCRCAPYYLSVCDEDLSQLQQEQNDFEITTEAQKNAAAVASHVLTALIEKRITLVQYRFIWSLLRNGTHEDSLSLLGDSSSLANISGLINKMAESYFLKLERICGDDIQRFPFYEMLQLFSDGAAHSKEDIAHLTFTKEDIIQKWICILMNQSLICEVNLGGSFQYIVSHQWVAALFRSIARVRLSGDHRDQVEAIANQYKRYAKVLEKANENYHKGSDKWGDGIASFCSITMIFLSGVWSSFGMHSLSEFIIRMAITLCICINSIFLANFIRYNACICKRAMTRILFIPVILLGLFPLYSFLIPGMEKAYLFWLIFQGTGNATIGLYFLVVRKQREETARKYFCGKGVEFIAIGAVLCLYGLMTGLWQVFLVCEPADSNFITFLQISISVLPCIAYLALIVMAIYNYCNPQFLPSLRLKACMLDNENFDKQHSI